MLDDKNLYSFPLVFKKASTACENYCNVYPHRFRHTYACQLLDNGAPLEFIQGMLGMKKHLCRGSTSEVTVILTPKVEILIKQGLPLCLYVFNVISHRVFLKWSESELF
jgi:hypothetical protein